MTAGHNVEELVSLCTARSVRMSGDGDEIRVDLTCTICDKREIDCHLHLRSLERPLSGSQPEFADSKETWTKKELIALC